MNEIEKILQKIKSKGHVPALFGTSDIKARARKLMDLVPETSSWKLKDFEDLFKKLEMEEDLRISVIADHL